MITIKNYANIAEAHSLIEFVSHSLGISYAEVIITKNDKLLNKFNTNDFQLSALLYKAATPDVYNLIIREYQNEPISLVLCHEMIHLKQFVDGRLELDMNTKTFIWEGKRYSGSISYGTRPWEIEAFEKQWSLLRSYKKHIRESKKKNQS